MVFKNDLVHWAGRIGTNAEVKGYVDHFELSFECQGRIFPFSFDLVPESIISNACKDVRSSYSKSDYQVFYSFSLRSITSDFEEQFGVCSREQNSY